MAKKDSDKNGSNTQAQKKCSVCGGSKQVATTTEVNGIMRITGWKRCTSC